MQKNHRRSLAVVAFGVAALSGSGTATAVTIFEGSDYAYTPSSNGSYAQACDREKDGRSVYNAYTRNDGANRRVEVFAGSGHCQNSDTSESNPVYRIKACENITARPDACSDYAYRN